MSRPKNDDRSASLRPLPSLRALPPLLRRIGARACAVPSPRRSRPIMSRRNSSPSRRRSFPGQPATVALRLKIEDGWQRTGAIPAIGPPDDARMEAAAGIRRERDRMAGAAGVAGRSARQHGYEGEVLHLATLTPPPTRKPGATLDARGARRLARVQGNVHPRGADSRSRCRSPTRARPTRVGPRIAAARAALPRPLAGWKVDARATARRSC